MATPHSVLQFVAAAQARGERTALIVLAGIEGGAARGLGTVMGVSATGDWLGSLSGGCVEAALVGEAQRVIAAGQPELLRIGAGSPLIDIRLPCGSAIDLLLVPDPDPAAITQVLNLLDRRSAAVLKLGTQGPVAARSAKAADETSWTDARFTLRIDPALRLIIAGHGEEVPALAALARTWDAKVLVLTPDERIAEACGPDAVFLAMHGPHPALVLDRWTALVMLFHDHDWEVPLLAQALAQDALFIGAMGSTTTHGRRLGALADAGVTAADAARVQGPIGLIPATRDPQSLALSILAQVVAAYTGRS